MKNRLSKDQADLLLSIIRRRTPDSALSVTNLLTLAEGERLKLCDLLADELAATGLTATGDLRPRGELIEDLIDALNPRSPD
jgi:hypothetical protein